MTSDGLEALSEFAEAFLADLSPARRKAVARKVGQQLRRSNLARQAANVQPDGSDMAPRRKRTEFRGGKDLRGKRMFRRLRMARRWRIVPRADGVTIRPSDGSTARIAAAHHFGLVGQVGQTRDGKMIRTRYTARRLMGFGSADIDELTGELLKWLDRD